MKNKRWAHKNDRRVSANFNFANLSAFSQVKKHVDIEKNKNMEKNIKKHTRNVEKIQENLERQIYNHVEL